MSGKPVPPVAAPQITHASLNDAEEAKEDESEEIVPQAVINFNGMRQVGFFDASGIEEAKRSKHSMQQPTTESAAYDD